MMIWEVKDIKDRVIFWSESYQEAFRFWADHTSKYYEGLYLDYRVVAF